LSNQQFIRVTSFLRNRLVVQMVLPTRDLQNLRFLLLAPNGGTDKGFAFSGVGASISERLMVEENYKQIKREIFELLKTECAKQEVKVEVKETKKRARSRPSKGKEQAQSF
jgi:hypothetical protein